MPRIEKSYQLLQGQYGTRRLLQSGRCDGSSSTIDELEGDVSYGKLVKFPNASGCTWKALDGKRPRIYTITPPTMTRPVRCVKVEAQVIPLAPQQNGGAFNGMTVCTYRVVYQEVPQ